MTDYLVDSVYYHGQPEDVMDSVEAYLENIDSTSQVLYAPPIIVGGVGWCTAFIVHTTKPA
jgi:hypothetical protein